MTPHLATYLLLTQTETTAEPWSVLDAYLERHGLLETRDMIASVAVAELDHPEPVAAAQELMFWLLCPAGRAA